MKLIKLISISALLFLSCIAFAQAGNSPTIMYDLELTQTGDILGTGDTAYNVVLVLNDDDFSNLENVTLSDELSDQFKSIKTKDPQYSSKISKEEDKYKIDMDDWSVKSEWRVLGEMKDGKEVVMENRQNQIQNPHKIVPREQVNWNVKIDTLEPIIEPKPIPEPIPVEPDTLGRRINLF